MLDEFERLHAQPFVFTPSIESFNICVLGRLAWLNLEQYSLVSDAPVDHGLHNSFRAIVAAHCSRTFSPSVYTIIRLHDSFTRQRKIDLNAKAFSVLIIEHIERPEFSNINQAVAHEVDCPDLVNRYRHAQFVWPITLDSSSGFDPQIQLQLTVNSIYALIVPTKPRHVPQVCKM